MGCYDWERKQDIRINNIWTPLDQLYETYDNAIGADYYWCYDKSKDTYVPMDKYNPFFNLHHIIPKKMVGKNAFDNILLLCLNCHSEIHYNGCGYSLQQLQELNKKNFRRLNNGKHYY